MKRMILVLCLLLASTALAETDPRPDDFLSELAQAVSSWLGVSASQPVSSGDYEYRIRDNAATVVKYTGSRTSVRVPSKINDTPVTEIGEAAFSHRKLKRVTLPDSLRRIGERAFEYCEITDALVLPENVTISENAFSYAQLPSAVALPAGATVENCAFSYCKGLESVDVGQNATLHSRAFSYCDGLKRAVFADGARLAASAFEYCRNLERAVLRGSVHLETDAFACCGDVTLTEADESPKPSIPEASSEERVLEILGSPATLDGVTVTLDRAFAEKDSTGYTYTLSGALENGSDEGIMQVIYTVALIDEQGEEFRSFGLVYDGETAAIPPHSKIDFLHDDIRWGKQSAPAAVKIGVSSVKTETELPPARVPAPGEPLYQALGDENLAAIRQKPPVELSFHVDQGGYGRTATFQPGESLDRAVDLLCAIQIGDESGEWVTDNDNRIRLAWEDGAYTTIRLNLNTLEYWIHSTPHTYTLQNLDPFWSFCANYLEQDDD